LPSNLTCRGVAFILYFALFENVNLLSKIVLNIGQKHLSLKQFNDTSPQQKLIAPLFSRGFRLLIQVHIERGSTMKKGFTTLATLFAVALISSAAVAADKGEAIFNEKCASCHPGGGNIMNPSETLKGIKNPGKIIKKTRKGGGGMPAFDSKTISDADVKLLANYIVKTFKK